MPCLVSFLNPTYLPGLSQARFFASSALGEDSAQNDMAYVFVSFVMRKNQDDSVIQ